MRLDCSVLLGRRRTCGMSARCAVVRSRTIMRALMLLLCHGLLVHQGITTIKSVRHDSISHELDASTTTFCVA